MSENECLPVRVANMIFDDTHCPAIRIHYVDISKDATNPKPYCKFTVDNNGSGGSKLLITIDVGASATNYTNYQFSAFATGVTDPGGVDGTPTHTQVLTVGALITAINALGIGLVAHRLHAPADRSLDSDDFIDVASTSLGPLWLDTLFADASEVLTCAYRIGIPENINGKIGRGRMELISINSQFSHTNGVFKMSYDPDEADYTKEELLPYGRALGSTGVITELWDLHNDAPVFKGPILVEVTGSALTASSTAAFLTIAYRNYEV